MSDEGPRRGGIIPFGMGRGVHGGGMGYRPPMPPEPDFSNEEPLEFMLRTMRDSQQPLITRMEAAKAAAPYRHPRLGLLNQAEGDSLKIEIIGGLPQEDDAKSA